MDGLAEKFAELRAWARGNSPLYERLCGVVIEDPDLLDLAATVPEGRWPPHVFLSAVHYRLLDGDAHRLAEYYPSATADPREPDDDLDAAFRDFCLSRADDLRPLLATRRTQTNAVRRCAVLYPAIAHVAARTDGPLALIEIGPSAGLNLLFDRYRYEYDGRVAGATDSPVAIESAVRGDGDPPLPERPPAIASRVGVDLNPMDVTDPDDAAWLRALTWPEHEERRRLLSDAIGVAREDPPRLVAGDAAEELPALVDAVPPETPVCVFDTMVLYQLPDAVRAEIDGTIRELAAERPLHWLSGDGDVDGEGEAVPVEWTRERDGRVRTDRVAAFQPHGEWIEWVA